ncbi:MAG: beta-ketoacyl synthase N-terminal-like domain-containing protein [Polyangiaceae bacterium]
MSGLVVSRFGLATPLGLSAAATQAAVAAGLSWFRETQTIGRGNEPIRAAWLPALPPETSRVERVLFFARRAIAECTAGLDDVVRSLPVFMALPEVGHGAPLVATDLSYPLAQGATPRLDFSARAVLAGRAGFLLALDAARTAIVEQRTEAAIVAGFDSYCDPASLDLLGSANRTLGPENPDGLIPGEGAGALLLSTPAFALRARLPALLRLNAIAAADDSRPFRKRSAMQGHALNHVFHQLRAADPGRADALFSCQTGEGFWSRELSVVSLRNGPLMPEPRREYLLSRSLGDTGAAACPIQLAVLVHLHSRVWRRGQKLERALIYGASDAGRVAACTVSVLRSAARSGASGSSPPGPEGGIDG